MQWRQWIATVADELVEAVVEWVAVVELLVEVAELVVELVVVGCALRVDDDFALLEEFECPPQPLTASSVATMQATAAAALPAW